MFPYAPDVYVPWLAAFLIRCAILVLMWEKGLARTFPVFFSYTLVVNLRSGVGLYLTSVDLNLAFYAYWIGEAVSVALGLAVIGELFRHVLKPYPTLDRLGRTVFRWVAVGLVILALLSMNLPAGEDNIFMGTILPVARAVRILQFGLLFFLFVFSSYFGLGWRHLVFGIALGMSLFVSVELTAVSMRSESGWIAHETWSLVTRLSYVAATLIWFWYIAVPQPAEQATQKVPARETVERWNQALLQFLHR
jgi:hypothetical protein